MKRAVIPAVGLCIAVVVGAWWLALSRSAPVEEVQAIEAAKPRAKEAPRPLTPESGVVAMQPQAFAPTPPPTPAQAAKYELRDTIRDAPDLRAYYERNKDLPDPTGERSYRLAEAIFECTAFIDAPYESLSGRLALTKAARESPRRQEVFTAMVERCKGFSGDSAALREILQGLHAKAEAAGYPAEIARSLRMEAGRRDPEWADRTAISLLSAATPDPDVIHELAQFLNTRNAGNPAFRGTDAAARSIGFGLLECQYGADCGPRSRPVMMTCIAYGACDLQRIEEAILVQGTQVMVSTGVITRDRLARQIAERDWTALGLGPRFKPPT